jgi:hypothetical protein
MGTWCRLVGPRRSWACRARRSIPSASANGCASLRGQRYDNAGGLVTEGTRWVYIPLVDVARYAEEVGVRSEGNWANPCQLRSIVPEARS